MKKVALAPAVGRTAEFFLAGKLHTEVITKVTAKRAYFGEKFKPRDEVKVLG